MSITNSSNKVAITAYYLFKTAMAVDFTFEEFSNDLFRYMWRVFRNETSYASNQNEQHEDEMFQSPVFSFKIFNAVHTRLFLLWFHDLSSFNEKYQQFSEYNTDFYIFLQKTFHGRKYTQHLNIFDKFLTVCEIAVMMGYVCFLRQNNSISMDFAVRNCAMFLDTEIKDKFYDAGGWIQLKYYSLTYQNLHGGFHFRIDDLQYTMDIFLNVSTNYDMEMLMNFFKRIVSRYNEHNKNAMCCSKCSLLFPAIKYIAFSEYSCYDEIDVIEGLLQMILITKSLEQSDNALKSSEIVTTTLTNAENSYCMNSNKEVMENDKYINESRPPEESSLELNTLKLLSELFGENKDNTQEFDFCSLCLKSLSNLPGHLIKDVQTEKRNCTKINILNEVKSFNVGACISRESKASERKPISNHALQKPTNIESVSTLIESAFSSFETNNPAPCRENIPDTETLKDLLKLFIGLGIEPIRTEILSDLKEKYKESSEGQIRIVKSDNLQNTCVLPNSITNQEGLKDIHKHKKKRNRKKKNVHVNKNVM